MRERPPVRVPKITTPTVKAPRSSSAAKPSHSETAGFVDAHRDGRNAAQVFGIGELAEELGTTARAIRFYEEKGLLTPQRVGQNRVYTRRERARLQLILRGKSLGLSLREMQHYLDLYGKQGEGRRKQLELAIERTEEMIAELRERREALDRTLDEIELIRRVSQERLAALRVCDV